MEISLQPQWLAINKWSKSLMRTESSRGNSSFLFAALSLIIRSFTIIGVNKVNSI